jgi:hypothetical protein
MLKNVGDRRARRVGEDVEAADRGDLAGRRVDPGHAGLGVERVAAVPAAAVEHQHEPAGRRLGGRAQAARLAEQAGGAEGEEAAAQPGASGEA